MNESPISQAIDFLSDHFESVFTIQLAIAFMLALVILAVRLRFIDWKRFYRSTFQGILLGLVMAGQCFFVFVIGYLFWLNYTKPSPEINLTEDVLATTQWVKDDRRVYFVDGTDLFSVRLTGKDKRKVFSAYEPLREYHFSPDGRSLLVATARALYHIDRPTGESSLIDEVFAYDSMAEIEGVVSGIRWAPDSRKFCYEIARWSRFSSQDNIYVYDLDAHNKRAVASPTRKLSSLYWDRASQNLYYLRHEAQDTSYIPNAYEVSVFRVPLATLEPERLTKIPYDEKKVPVENLGLRGIDLFLGAEKLSFGRTGEEDDLVADNGSVVGIDEGDNLYFVRKKWFRKRLFKIPRRPVVADMSRYQYKGGPLVLDHIRWLPGSRYVLMHHRQLGILVLEPATRKIGFLIQAAGDTYGWYDPLPNGS